MESLPKLIPLRIRYVVATANLALLVVLAVTLITVLATVSDRPPIGPTEVIAMVGLLLVLLAFKGMQLNPWKVGMRERSDNLNVSALLCWVVLLVCYGGTPHLSESIPSTWLTTLAEVLIFTAFWLFPLTLFADVAIPLRRWRIH